MLDMELILILLRFFTVIISLLGFSLFINRKFKVKKEFTLILVIAVISVALVIFGIINIIKYASFIIFISGLILFIYEFIKCDKRKLLSINNILMGVIILYFSIIVTQMHLEHYDNFSHWAVIVKDMLQIDSLPNINSTLVTFKSYPPATACFLYFVCKIAGSQEVVMMLGQVLITVSASITFLGFINEKLKNKFIIFIIVVLLFTTIGYIYIGIVPYNELLVDTILTLVATSSMAILYYYKNNLKKLVIINCIFATFLILIKNSGIFFVLINLILTIYCILKYITLKNKVKDLLRIIVVLVIAPVIVLLMWKLHVKYVFGEEGTTSKHSMSVSNYIENFKSKSLTEIVEVTKNYIKKVIDIKDISFKIMLLINIIMIIYITYYIINKNRDKIKENIIFMSILDFVYIIYMLMLYGMYLFSMESGEASSIGGYSRYAFTITSYLLLVFSIKVIRDIQKDGNKKLIGVFVISTIFFNVFNIVENSNKYFLIGVDNYEIGDRKKIDKIIKDVIVEKNSDYIIYAPNTDFGSGYLQYMSKYLLDTNSVYFVKTLDNNIVNKFDYLIVYDENEYIKNYFMENNLEYKGIGIYCINQ